MEYQKIINLLDDTINPPSKSRRRNWVERKDKSRGTYNVSNQIKFEASLIRSSLWDYSDAYIHVKSTIAVPNTGTIVAPNNRNKMVIFKNCAPFLNCISETNNAQVDDDHDIDVVMPIFKLGNFCQYYRDESALGNNGSIIDSNSISFKFKQQITGQTMAQINFWRTNEMPLTNFEFSLLLAWSKNCFLVTGIAADQ